MKYKERDDILEELGYDDYKHYLKSDLWSEIRDRVLKESGYECICCGNQKLDETLVMQIHHMVYSKKNLSGESLYGLVAICRSCHVKAEFKPRTKTKGRRGRRRKLKMGAKKTLGEANAHVLGIGEKKKKKNKKKKTPSQFYRVKTKCKICKLESDNRKEVCTYCKNEQEAKKFKKNNE